ncbi:hypothetical protein [Vampirovibrio chlorellavorus]|uniref:hypothetical protein n=1 Tax=Vampirovibrio chlorellavorus TaxID=758823 RepID=UPI0026F10680|nr:hypothetical protein [Vampirovibrio chlorellavorus]
MADLASAVESPPIIQQGRLVAFFAFDLGYEISLERVGSMLASSPMQPLSRKKQTPNYLQFAYRPQVLNLGEMEAFGDLRGEIQATIFDFGAVSISYHWLLSDGNKPLTLAELPGLSQRMFDFNLEDHARAQVKSVMSRILPAITRPELSTLVEDYYVFVLERFDTPLPAEDFLSRYSETLAQILQFDTQSLSHAQRVDTLSKAISYYERDLVLIDWNAAIVYDSDYIDTLNVLELLNVELLEARYMDDQLDKRIKNYERLSQKQPAWWMPLSLPYRQSINELAELRIESSVLAERVDNSLKLIGDLYLARVYSAASEQFYLPTWDASISRKLDIIANLYQILTDRVSSSQGQTLELIIIILILIEIVLSLLRG